MIVWLGGGDLERDRDFRKEAFPSGCIEIVFNGESNSVRAQFEVFRIDQASHHATVSVGDTVATWMCLSVDNREQFNSNTGGRRTSRRVQDMCRDGASHESLIDRGLCRGAE